MPIKVQCPVCGKEGSVPDASAGKNVRCPHCKGTVPVPAAQEPLQATVISVVCPSCGARSFAPQGAAGKALQCPGCHTDLTVPQPRWQQPPGE